MCLLRRDTPTSFYSPAQVFKPALKMSLGNTASLCFCHVLFFTKYFEHHHSTGSMASVKFVDCSFKVNCGQLIKHCLVLFIKMMIGTNGLVKSPGVFIRTTVYYKAGLSLSNLPGNKQFNIIGMGLLIASGFG